jgi:hypothetical protein
MTSLSRLGRKTAANIDKMIERPGIDLGYRAVPRFGLLFSCALRNCGFCTRRVTCTECLTKDPIMCLGHRNFVHTLICYSNFFAIPALVPASSLTPRVPPRAI